MEEQSSRTINAFDSLFTTNKIQMLKILLPRLIPEQQGGFAIYIKLLELQYTFSFLRRHPGMHLLGNAKRLSADFFQEDNSGTLELLDELLPFSGPEERLKIQNIRNLIENFKKIKEMMDMIQMMQELFPEGMGSEGNPMDFFSNMAAMSGMSDMPNMSGMPNMSDMPDMSAMANIFSAFQAFQGEQDNPDSDSK